MFSVLGMCVTGTTSNSLTAESDLDKKKFFDCGNAWAEGCTSVHRQNNCKSCSFLQLDGSLRKSSQSFIGKSNWVVLMFDSSEQNDVGIHRLPKLHHIHCNGLTLSEYDVHVCKSQLLLLLLAFLHVAVVKTSSVSVTDMYHI
jgi:phosphatidylinositol glycan class Q protein